MVRAKYFESLAKIFIDSKPKIKIEKMQVNLFAVFGNFVSKAF
jgi:hypothetical protein